jgi:hypothetical protein
MKLLKLLYLLFTFSFLISSCGGCGGGYPSRSGRPARPERTTSTTVTNTNVNTNTTDTLVNINVPNTPNTLHYLTKDFKTFVPVNININITSDSLYFNNVPYYVMNNGIYSKIDYLHPEVVRQELKIEPTYIKVGNYYYLYDIIPSPIMRTDRNHKTSNRVYKSYVTKEKDTWYNVSKLTGLTSSYLSSKYGICRPNIKVNY